MSRPIEEIDSRKERRETALETWAAAIYVHSALKPSGDQAQAPIGTGGSSFRKELLQTGPVTKSQTVEQAPEVVPEDTVETVQPSQELATLDRLEAAARAIRATHVETPGPEPTESPEVAESEPTVVTTQEVETPVVVAEDTPLPQAAATFVPSRPSKNVAKTEKAREPEVPEEEAPLLVTPGDSPKASAYVLAKDLIGDSPAHRGYGDFMVAL